MLIRVSRVTCNRRVRQRCERHGRIRTVVMGMVVMAMQTLLVLVAVMGECAMTMCARQPHR